MYKSAIVAVCIATSFSWVMPARAFPVSNPPLTAQATSSQPDIVKVDYNDHSGGHIYRPHNRSNYGYRHGYRGGYRGDRGYYGNRHYHHGGGNVGAIIGGLAAGAIIGGALSARPHYGSHASSCASRYRTYRASDNTYQPTNGPRRQCR